MGENIDTSIKLHTSVPSREITKRKLVVTPLEIWACDWSILPMLALLRAYSDSVGHAAALFDG